MTPFNGGGGATVPRNDDDNLDGRVNGEQPEEAEKDHMGWRLLFMLLIAFMLSISQTVLTVLTVIQFVIMLVNNGEKNARLADFGTDLGIWMAKAARYQAAASNVKPWPWTDLD
jgi:succinate-acetate transporter protein